MIALYNLSIIPKVCVPQMSLALMDEDSIKCDSGNGSIPR